ncbi:MAG: Nif3-like dinuclear metal center hexameric protein [Rikenellaceae bacterium]
MQVKDITKLIEEFAPLKLQASYDNAGLIVGREDREVQSALLAVDLTEEVIAEALEMGIDMIITHHPIIFSPLKRFNSRDYVERCVEQAIKHDLVIYAAHTNLDSAEGGMSWRLGEMIGVENMRVLEMTDADLNGGFGIVGELREQVVTYEYIDKVAKILELKALRHSDITKESVQRVAICTGSGGSMIELAVEAEADLYITADLRYNDFFTAQNRVMTLDIGHYESEYCAIEIIFDILSKKMINFALHKSLRGRNPVNYRSYIESRSTK